MNKSKVISDMLVDVESIKKVADDINDVLDKKSVQSNDKEIFNTSYLFSNIKVLGVLIGISIMLLLIVPRLTKSNVSITDSAKFEEIHTDNKGAYIVRNVVYTGNSLEIEEIGKVMNQIRSECRKPCKINLYSDRKAYEIDVSLYDSSGNFVERTDEDREYLSSHVIAFWGISDGDVIEYFPLK